MFHFYTFHYQFHIIVKRRPKSILPFLREFWYYVYAISKQKPRFVTFFFFHTKWQLKMAFISRWKQLLVVKMLLMRDVWQSYWKKRFLNWFVPLKYRFPIKILNFVRSEESLFFIINQDRTFTFKNWYFFEHTEILSTVSPLNFA